MMGSVLVDGAGQSWTRQGDVTPSDGLAILAKGGRLGVYNQTARKGMRFDWVPDSRRLEFYESNVLPVLTGTRPGHYRELTAWQNAIGSHLILVKEDC